MFGTDRLKSEVVVDVYGSVAWSGHFGVYPMYAPVAATATITPHTTQFHKGRSLY